jgi:hypothetical protein|tara:strand:+ start:2573 stop:3109 length:537 start_codon:yes stop_codon:yes gene_type:complete
MLSQEILDLIKEGKGVQARELTHDILNAKLSELIQDKYDEIAPTAFGEAKKAPKTDKEDDGEGMDPVGHGDSDIDNDGDSDDSDDYLKNRRKTIKKAIKKEAVSKRSAGLHKGGEHSYGVPTQTYRSASPEQKSSIKQKHYQDREGQERDKEARRKRDERDKEKRKRERGIGMGTDSK